MYSLNKDPFEFHRRLPLRKTTEDLPYRLAGIKKVKEIVKDSASESNDEIEIEFNEKVDILHDPKRIKKDYTFTKKKPKFVNKKIRNPKTALSRRSRIDVDSYFNKTPKSCKQTSIIDAQSIANANSSLYNFYLENGNKKSEKSYSNFDSSKSDGCKNIYPFLTQFDYISEEEKQKREHLKSIHLNGTSLVPSSCKELQVPSEFKTGPNFTKQYPQSLNDTNECEEENYQEIENWQNFLKNENNPMNDENFTNLQSKSNTEEIPPVIPAELSLELANTALILDNPKESSRFNEILKNTKPKTFNIDSNLQDKVTTRVLMKKKTTAALHNASVISHLSQSVPLMWPSAKKSLVVIRHEKPLHDYLENRQRDQLLTNNEINALGRTLQKVENKRKMAKEKQKIPDWARGGSEPILITEPKKTKVTVKSKLMKEIDFLI